MNMDVAADDPRFGLGYALVAYSFFIVAFFVYVAWMHVQAARLRRRLEDVEKRLGLGDPSHD